MADQTQQPESIVGGLMGLRDPDLLLNVGLGLMSAAKYGGNVGDGLSQALGNYQQQKMQKMQMQRMQAQLPIIQAASLRAQRMNPGGGGAPPQGPLLASNQVPPQGPVPPQGQAPMPQGAPQQAAPAGGGLMGGDSWGDMQLGALMDVAGMNGAGLTAVGKAGLEYDPRLKTQMAVAGDQITQDKELIRQATTPTERNAALLKFYKDSGMLDVSRSGVVTGIGGLDLNSLGISNLNPQSGTMLANGAESAIPGAAQARATISGAEAGGRAMNTPQVLPTAGGGSTLAYPGDVAGAPPVLRGTGMGSPRGGGAAPPPRGGTPGAAQQKAQGPQGPWGSVPKLNIPQGVGESDLYTQGRLKKAADKDAELSSELGKESGLAEQQLEFSREAQKVLGSAETGPLSDFFTKNRAKLIELGVPAALIPSSGTVTPTMELNKALKNAALQGARQTYGSRMSQMEVKLQTDEMSPSASMTRDAIASLMQQNNIRALYAKQRGLDYGKYQQQGGDPFRFESWYASAFPITKFAQAASASPEELRAEAKRRGLAQ